MKIYQQYMYSYPHKTAYRPITKDEAVSHVAALRGRRGGLYVHLPFCESKCGYCNLFSVAGLSEAAVDDYLSAVARQVAQIGQILPWETVRFEMLTLGGGTPAYLSVRQLEWLLNLLATIGVDAGDRQSIIELSPNQTDDDKLSLLRQAGFWRVSIGVQSFHDAELAALGRGHRSARAHQALEQIAANDFAAFNMDFIYGIPGQTMASFLDSLRQGLAYRPTELFLYPLYIKPATGLYGRLAVDETAAYGLYQAAVDFLGQEGWHQTSMRRFTREVPPKAPPAGCGGEYNLALGLGGRSYLGDLHLCAPYAVRAAQCMANLRQFLAQDDFLSGLWGYRLNLDEQKRRYGVKNLLYYTGIPLQDYRQRFGSDCYADFPWLSQLQTLGLAEEQTGYLRLTAKGLGYSDCIGPQFISPQVAELSAAYVL